MTIKIRGERTVARTHGQSRYSTPSRATEAKEHSDNTRLVPLPSLAPIGSSVKDSPSRPNDRRTRRRKAEPEAKLWVYRKG